MKKQSLAFRLMTNPAKPGFVKARSLRRATAAMNAAYACVTGFCQRRLCQQPQSFALLAALVAALTLGVPAAVSQEDMKMIKAEAFKAHTRPPAIFVHDAHNEKAKIDDCAQCHHGKSADGKRDKDDITAGTPCADCHAVDAKQGTPLKRAYHQQCIRCHVEKKLGPTHCGGCHKR